jgi:hypothetical protein
MTETILKKIIKLLFIALVVGIMFASVILQREKPEWFVKTTSKVPSEVYFLNNTEANNLLQGITEAELKQTEPSIYCQPLKPDNCTYINLPTDEPYIMKTPWRFLYQYQYLIALTLLIVGAIIYKETLRKWKDTYLN